MVLHGQVKYRLIGYKSIVELKKKAFRKKSVLSQTIKNTNANEKRILR